MATNWLILATIRHSFRHTLREIVRFKLRLATVLAIAMALAIGFGSHARAAKPLLQGQRNVAAAVPAVEGDGDEIFKEDEGVDEDAVKLRELGQKQFVAASYESMATTYSVLCALPSATLDDYMWRGHAYQLSRNWPTACDAYQKALAKLDAEIASTEVQLKAFGDVPKGKESTKFAKGNKYPLLKRAQETLPKQWPDLVLQIGQLELVEGKNPAAAAKTLSKGLRFAPELAVPLDELMLSAEGTLTKKVTLKNPLRSNELIVPLETLRFLAQAQEQLEQPAAAFDTWARVRLGNIIYQTAYATTEPARLKELASKLAQDTLQPYQVFILKNLDRELSKQRKVAEFLKSGPANPFKASPLPGFEFARSGPAAASLAKLRDGRMVMAYTTGDHHQTRIQLSLSRDGITWEVPWEFAHNSVFNTRAPSVVVDDHGEIWMLCLSQRLTTQRFASWPYQLWLTHSRDGHEWSPLRVLQMKSESARIEIATSQYQEVPQLMRLPGNRFGIIWRDQFAAAKSPGEISVLNTLPLPRTNNKPLVSNTHATFESGGRCHLVFDDFGRGLYYTRSEDLQIWTPLQFQGAAGTNSSISMPQLLLEGDHAVLLHEENNGVWLQRGAVSPEGLKLGTKIQIADHLMPLNGSRLYLDGDRVLIPAGGHDYLPNLLTASFAELLVP